MTYIDSPLQDFSSECSITSDRFSLEHERDSYPARVSAVVKREMSSPSSRSSCFVVMSGDAALGVGRTKHSALRHASALRLPIHSEVYFVQLFGGLADFSMKHRDLWVEQRTIADISLIAKKYGHVVSVGCVGTFYE